MITKQCKKNIHMHVIYGSIFVGVLIMLCMLATMIAVHEDSYFMYVLIACGIILVLSVIIGYIISMPKVSRFKKHLKAQNGTDIDSEKFKALDKHFSISDNWIVYHKGTYYLPLYRKNISSIQFDGHHLDIRVMNDAYVYTFKCSNDVYHALIN